MIGMDRFITEVVKLDELLILLELVEFLEKLLVSEVPN